jgi:hypothetical protein
MNKYLTMKKNLILALMLFSAVSVFAQKTNLVFFTEQGENFYLSLNGIQQNTGPQSNLMVTAVPGESCKVNIKFDDPALGEINKNLIFGQGTETSYIIRLNNSDEWVIRYVKESPLAQAPAPPEDRSVVAYQVPGPSAGVSASDGGTTVIINMNVGGVTNTSSSSSQTISTSAVTTTTGVNEPEPIAIVEPPPPPPPLPGYGGPVGCPWPMSPIDFVNVKSSISSKTFEDSKMTIAKQVVGANCLLCSQVKEIMMLFTYEDTKLDFAKFAYQHTYDLGNYYQLNDAFTYETTIDELNEYINSSGK